MKKTLTIFLILVNITLIMLIFSSKTAGDYNLVKNDHYFYSRLVEVTTLQIGGDMDKEIDLCFEYFHRLYSYTKKEYIVEVFNESIIDKIDPYLILSVMALESNFNSNAISNAGAIGLMQIMCIWWCQKYEITNNDLFNFRINIHVGINILKDYLKVGIKRGLNRYNGVDSDNYIYADTILKIRDNLLEFVEKN